ncbi:uncharacterized protein LOC142768371 [Rhipicephalus microplus]|uniref:uncharacterized protein LOC142768371 n=1 Tax=Rhipicephalus microplus TaxID=6941 RepID=UPI003F6CD591
MAHAPNPLFCQGISAGCSHTLAVSSHGRSGTEEYAAIDVLLQHVADLAAEHSYRPPRSAVRKHRAKKTPASASETASESASGSTAKRVRPTAQASWDDRHIAALECYAAESAAETSSQSEPELTPGTANEASHTPATSVDGPSQATHNRTPLRELSTNVPQPLPRGSARAQLAASTAQTPRRRTPLRAGRSQNEATLAFLEARYNQDLEMRLLSYHIDKRKLDLKIRQHEDKMKLLHQQHADDVRLREAEVEMRRMEMMAVLEERRANTAYQASQLQLIKELIEGKKE